MKEAGIPEGSAHFPEPFSVVPVVLEDGRRTWAVWTGWQWWGEHRPLRVCSWEHREFDPPCVCLQGS
jgi:hypothetical protein